MPTRPERLWDQYEGKAIAELRRGTGWWPAQTDPCPLEPPFETFDRTLLTKWDCAVNGWEAPFESNVLKRMIDSGNVVHAQGSPLVLPAVPLPNRDELIVITIAQFPEDDTTLPATDQLLRSLLSLRHPVAFELVGCGACRKYDHDRIRRLIDAGHSFDDAMEQSCIGWTEPTTTVQFTVHTSDADLAERQLATHYPNSAVVAGEASPCDLHVSLQSGRHACGCTLALDGGWCFPIRTYRQLAPDPLAVAIAAMENLGPYEDALLQVLFAPARDDWAENILEASAHPYKGESWLDNDQLRLMKEKLAAPLFAVSVRLAATCRDVFRHLVGWSEQFANQPHQRLITNQADWEDSGPDDNERWWLEISTEFRCTYRPGMLLNTEELAGMVHVPTAAVVSERLKRVKQRTRPVTETASKPGSVLLGENVHRGKCRPARIPADVRPWHTYVAGATGTGKSTLLLNMMLQDIEGGVGVGVLDPHGDLIADVLARIPPSRVKDVVYFNPTDRAYPPALNILDARNRTERERLISETVSAIHRFYPEAWGPRLQHVLTYTLATAMLIRGGTLRDVRRLLTDANFRYRVVSKLTDPDLLAFWNDEYPNLPKDSRDPILNKLSPFLLNSTARNIICQQENLIDFDAILNRRKIFLANLSFGLLTEPVAGILGSFLLTKLLSATFRRASIPAEKRRPFYLYVDEFQNFMNLAGGFDKLLSEARKYRLVLTMANQFVAQLSHSVRPAIFGNVGTLLAFRLGLDDARPMAHDLQGFTAEEIMSLDLGQAIARVGSSGHVFNLTTAPPPEKPVADPTNEVIASCRKQYGRPRTRVEAAFSQKSNGRPRAESDREPLQAKTPHPSLEITEDDLGDFVS